MTSRLRRLALAGCLLLSGLAALGWPPSAQAAPPALTWQAPTANTSVTGSPTAVSCVSSSFCMVVDRAGQAVRYASGWSAPVRVQHPVTVRGLTTVSCSSAGWCLAADDEGHTYRYAHRAWSSAGTLPFPVVNYPVRVVCLAHDDCLLVNGRAVYRWTGAGWSKPVNVLASSHHFGALSCPTRTFCMALDEDFDGASTPLRYDGHSWARTRPRFTSYLFEAIDCPTTTSCSVVGANATLATWDGRRWALGSAASTKSDDLLSISCATATDCVAVGRSGAVVRRTGDTWHPAVRVGPGGVLTGVSCVSRTYCVAVDGMGNRDVFHGRSWTALGSIDYTRGPIARVSCQTATSCQAVDEAGNVSQYAAGSGWSGRHRVDFHADFGAETDATLSCAGATFCLLGDSHGYVYEHLSSGWKAGPRAPFATLQPNFDRWQVSCTSATFCLGLDESGYSSVFNGRGWSAVKRIPHSDGELWAPSCASPTRCLAMSFDAVVSWWSGRGWTTPSRIASGAQNAAFISCAAPRFCAAESDKLLYTSNGGGWTKHLPAASMPNGPSAISCTSATFCAVADEAGGVVPFDGSHWGPPAGNVLGAPSDAVFPIAGLSCAGTSRCVAWNSASLAVTADAG